MPCAQEVGVICDWIDRGKISGDQSQVGLDDPGGLFQPQQVCDSGISISKQQHCPNISGSAGTWQCQQNWWHRRHTLGTRRGSALSLAQGMFRCGDAERAEEPAWVKCSLSSCVQEPSLVCPVECKGLISSSGSAASPRPLSQGTEARERAAGLQEQN